MLKILEKYGYSLPVKKSELYRLINSSQDILKKEGFDVQLKTVEELLKYEIICNGVLNKEKIDEAYRQCLVESREVLGLLNYEEKQQLFNGILQDVLPQCHSFLYDGEDIYFPYLEEFINHRYIHNYGMMMLKQHQQYIKDYPKGINQHFLLYGYLSMKSSFSSLIDLRSDQNGHYFYQPELKKIYLFDMNHYKILQEISFVDKYYKGDVDIEEMKRLLELYKNEQYETLKEELYSIGYISGKVYKKMNKKMK